MLEEAIKLAPLLGQILAALIASLIVVFGWFKVSQLNIDRDRKNRREELIIQFLLEAYRRLERTSNRDVMTEEQKIDFESAIGDIQLLGEPSLIKETVAFCTKQVCDKNTSFNEVLLMLRAHIRKELKLPEVNDPIPRYRLLRNSEAESGP